MRPTIIVPIGVILLAAVAVLFVQGRSVPVASVEAPSRDPEPATT